MVAFADRISGGSPVAFDGVCPYLASDHRPHLIMETS